MTYTAAMAITGVLRNPIGGRPIPEGIALYRALGEQFNIVLLNDPDTNAEEFQDFCITEQLFSHQGPMPWPATFFDDDAESRLVQVTGIRHGGYAMAFVIEPDPHTCALLLQKGYTTVLFTHADYAHPDWRPGAVRKPRPWSELAAQVEEQARLKAKDKRMETESE